VKEPIQFALLGLGAGAVYAMLAHGLVLIFRGSGILNLAHGAYAMLAAYTFHSLHQNRGWAFPVAMVASIAFITAIGVATDQVILRRLRASSALTRLIATLGVLVIIQGAITVIWGHTTVFVEPIFEARPVEVLGYVIPSDRLWLVAFAVIGTIVLEGIWRFTRAGWITEAVSENQRAAASLGWSPERVSSITWGLGAALAALAGILVTPITQLDVNKATLLVIAALAAALIAGFRSFYLTLLGGLALGVLQSLVSYYAAQTWWPDYLQTGVPDALPLLMIVAVLVIKGSSLPLRGHVFDRLPRVGTGRINWPVLVALTVAGGVIISLVSDANFTAAFTATFATAIILLSLVVLVGYAGQLSLAQYALAGVGALVAARLVVDHGWPFPASIGAGMLAASGIGLLFALPALRTRGINLAVTTLGLGLAVQAVVFNNVEISGGTDGIPVPPPTLFGLDLDPYRHDERYAIFALLSLVIAGIAIANLRRGRTGRRMLAVRDNERAAASLGINVMGAKLHAFAVAGALAGLGGVLIGFSAPAVTMFEFNPTNSIHAVANAVIGGIGYLVGPLLGALLVPASVGSLVALRWQGIIEYLPLIAGISLLVVLLSDPDGLVALNIKAAKAEVESKVAYLRPEVLLLAGLAWARGKRGKAAHGHGEARGTQLASLTSSTRIDRVPPRTLRLEDLTVRFGGVVAVDQVSFDVGPGEVVGLIGPNGAGKTSLLDGVTGFTRLQNGRVLLDDVRIDGWRAYRRARAGVARSWQALELFPDMTVLENVQAATDRRDLLSVVTDVVRPGRGQLSPAAVTALEEFGLASLLDRYPEHLAYGQRRLLAIARAVAAEPSVLLLDEPVAGLDDEATQEFAQLVRRLADVWGMAVLVIEHDMTFVMGICDRLVVIDFGHEIARGTPAEVARDPAAIAAYLGTSEDESAAPAASAV
jgi:ABC-type branched-subunit amino acid transport system ATPase component/branched-subunit amino acid ABC-type transport system permease component